MALEEIAARISAGLADKPFEGSLKFDCGEEGVIVLAGGSATTEDQDTDCTLSLSQDNLVKLLAGKLNPMTGLMMGKLKVSGNPAVAMKLSQLLKG